jgi:lipoprotein-anchoring transpeptidase ErfK/SrfK
VGGIFGETMRQNLRPSSAFLKCDFIKRVPGLKLSGARFYFLKTLGMDKPTFYGIIPANVRYAKIADRAKLIFSEITAMANKWGYCNASNGYFAGVWECDPSVISRHIASLEKIGAVRCEYVRDGKLIKERKIYPLAMGGVLHNMQEGIAPHARGVLHNMQEGIALEVKENNTSIIIQDVIIKETFASEPAPTPEYELAYMADEIGEVDETQVVVISIPDSGPKPEERKKVARKKESKPRAANPDPAPTKEMWDRYAQEYNILTGVEPVGQTRDFANLAELYKVVKSLVEKSTPPGDPVDGKGAALEYISLAREACAKDKWLKNNYTPGVLLSQFNSIQAKIRALAGTRMTTEEIEAWAKEAAKEVW